MKTTSEMLEMAKEYVSNMDEKSVFMFKGLEEKIDEEIQFAFWTKLAKADCKYYLTDSAVAITENAIYICGHANENESSYKVLELKPFKIMTILVKTTGTESYVLINGLYEFYTNSFDEAEDIVLGIGEELNIIGKREKNDDFDNSGHLIFNFGKKVSSMFLFVGILIHLLGWVNLIIGISNDSFSISCIAMLLGGFLTIDLGKVLGMCISGYGKLIINSDEIVKCMRNEKISK